MSALINDQLLPWKRYWVPWNGQVHSGWDGTGFITKPDGAFGRAFNPHLRAIEEILSRPLLVLSGQPGIGKTQAVEQLKAKWPEVAASEQLITLEARILDGLPALCRVTVDDPIWNRTLNSGGRIRLLIDGVDEATMRRVDLVSALVQILRNQPLERIWVILICRAAEWDAEQGRKFAQLWKSPLSGKNAVVPHDKGSEGKIQPNVETEIVWELCHLCEHDAKMASEACGIDPKQFLRAVRRLHVEGLAARPITLKMLLEEYETDPDFKFTYQEFYQRSILRMCGEVNEERSQWVGPYPPQEQIYRTAGRLAACLLFGRKSVIVRVRGARGNSSIELSCQEILGEDVAGTTIFQIDRKLLNFVLDTPLFSFRGPNYGFDQKTYAEFLAADYVAGCTVDQLRSLFCVRIHDRELIAPHLAEVAAWVAIKNEAWCLHVCAQDPEILLRVDVSAMANHLKAMALSNYLQKAAREEAFDHPGLDKFYATFNHPDLADQLRPYISDPTQNLVVRRIAIGIAGECRLRELEEDLWNRAKAGDPCIRYIATALGRITDLSATKQLMAILKGKFPPEAFRDLSGMAIRILVPKKMTVRDILPYLSRSAKKESLDSYHTACNYHLVEHLQLSDLVSALKWLREISGVFDSLHSLYRFATKVFEQTVQHLDNAQIRREAVSLWIHCFNNHHPHPTPIDSYEENSSEDGKAHLRGWKHSLAKAVINSGAITKPQEFYLVSSLIGSNDLEWMLLELGKAIKSVRAFWAIICAAHINAENAKKHSALVLQAYSHHPELRANLPALEPGLNVVQTLVWHYERWREGAEKQKAEMAARRPKSPRREEIIKKLVQNVRPKHHEWMDVCQWLWATDENEDRATSSRDYSDATDSPGWNSATPAIRKQMRVSARLFLLENEDTSRPPNQSTNGSRAAYFAIRLLFNQLKNDKELANAVRTRWASAIFNPYWNENADQPKMVKWCYALEPKLGAADLIAKMKADDANGLADIVLNSYLPCWDDRIRSRVSKLMLARKLSSRSTFRVLSWLAHNDVATAHKILAPLKKRTRLAFRDARDRAMLLGALVLFPGHYEKQLYPLIKKMNPETLRAMLLESSMELVHGDKPIFSSFNDEQLTAFGVLLFQIFPSEQYPGRKPDGEVHDVTAEDHIADLRRTILNVLSARATSTASAAILRIAENAASTDRIWIKWQYNEALRSAMAIMVPSRSSNEITGLVRSTKAALVDSVDDLIAVVLHSLARLQAKLRAKSNEWRALWNEDDQKTRKARRHSSGLEPKNEEALSDVVTEWLKKDLGSGSRIVFNQEVKISKRKFTDIKIEAFGKGSGNLITVIVEAKRCIHPEVKTAAKTQLVDRYLVPHELTRGIYLVGWYRGTWKPSRSVSWRPSSLDQARVDVANWAKNASGNGILISPFFLDCSDSPN